MKTLQATESRVNRALLLLSTSPPDDASSQNLVSLGHRYCSAGRVTNANVKCLCALPDSLEIDNLIHFRNQLVNLVLPHLAKVLNKQHDIELSESEWKLLVGHWLTRYVTALVQRHRDLEHILKNLSWSGVLIGNGGEPPMVAQNTADATGIFNSEEWDVYAKLRLLTLFGRGTVHSLPAQVPVPKLDMPTKPNFAELAKRAAVAYANAMTKLSSRNAKLFSIATYLPFKADARLHLNFRQVPQQWCTNYVGKSVKVDHELRVSISQKLAGYLDNLPSPLAKLVFEELFTNLPVSFLEGFDGLKAIATARGWPREPKVIFTSNSFDGDDSFKRYVIDQKRKGAVYVVGQHGNNYGTLKAMTPSIEEETSNIFVTWGWIGKLASQTRGFVLKLAGVELQRKQSDRYLLLQLHLDNSFNFFDSFLSHETYFLSQVKFANLLDDSVLEALSIRLHPSTDAFGWGENTKWAHGLRMAPKFSLLSDKIYDEFERAQLVIHSYDSTGLLECLAQNIPTVAFWAEGLSHLNDSAKPFYEILVRANIVHFSPESLAKHINAIHSDVDVWWYSKEVQDARLRFSREFARTSKAPIRDLVQLIGGES